MPDLIHGTFHFHSTYSHDGRSTLRDTVATLRGQRFAFCIMTEHFEDFDERTFRQYVAEVATLNDVGDFVTIPGVEVNIAGIDTIVFPALDYTAMAQWATDATVGPEPLFRVLAHPAKYQFETVARHLETYRINAIELWNQQEDGRYIPPVRFLTWLQAHPCRQRYRYFFGCDLHEASLTIANVLAIQRPVRLTPDAIMAALSSGYFTALNNVTGIEYRNQPNGSDFDAWLEALQARSHYRGRALQTVRRCLRRGYRMLPRQTQHRLNDVKNYVRNKV